MLIMKIWSKIIFLSQLLILWYISIVSFTVTQAESPFDTNLSNETIKLYLMPHSHNDLGWDYTIDEFFEGVPKGSVKNILDNIINSALTINPKRKFSQVELAYFSRWWKTQNSTVKDHVKKLINTNQFEFLNGGWSMNDEACPYYEHIIDQFTLGHRFLKNEFGYYPDVGWSIDPFGHSATQSFLLSQMNYKAFFMDRIHFKDKENRISNQNMEFIWKPFNLSKVSNAEHDFDGTILGHIDYWIYYSPPKINETQIPCHSILCGERFCGPLEGNNFTEVCLEQDDDDAKNDTNMPGNQIQEKHLPDNVTVFKGPFGNDVFINYTYADIFIDGILSQTKAFPTKRIAHNIGGDFLYWNETDAIYYYIDKLIEYINNGTSKHNIVANYSTRSQYIKDLIDELKLKINEKESSTSSNIATNEINMKNKLTKSIKVDDFFAYAESKNEIWTGYFTSKSRIKGMIFEYWKYLNTVRKMLAQSSLQSNVNQIPFEELASFEENLSISIHHDGITGTSKAYVTYDYINKLYKVKQKLNEKINSILSNIVKNNIGEEIQQWYQCNLNTTANECEITQQLLKNPKNQNDHVILIAIFNGVESRQALVRIKVPHSRLRLVNEKNKSIPIDIICSPYSINNDKSNNKDDFYDSEDCTLYFYENFDAYNYHFYKLFSIRVSSKVEDIIIDRDYKIHITPHDYLSIYNDLKTFDFQYCMEDTIKFYACTNNNFTIDYEYYSGYIGNKTIKDPSSGAYLFRIVKNTTDVYSKIIEGRIFNGFHVLEIYIQRLDLISIIRLNKYNLDYGLEIETLLNPVNITDNLGKEIILSIQSHNIKNTTSGKVEFFTDSNGLFMMNRTINYKQDFEYGGVDSLYDTIPLNYYPVTSAIYIENKDYSHRMTLMNDRAQGGTSRQIGQIELMIHRICLSDDDKGVNETLNEFEPDTNNTKQITVRTYHNLVFSSRRFGVNPQQRTIQYINDNPLIVYFASTKMKYFENQNIHQQKQKEYFGGILPQNMKTILRFYENGEYILRLQNMNDDQNVVHFILVNQNGESEFLNRLTKSHIIIDNIEEVILTTTKTIKEVSQERINWNKILYNLTQENTNQNVNNMDKTIILDFQPLEMRTFSIKIKGKQVEIKVLKLIKKNNSKSNV